MYDIVDKHGNSKVSHVPPVKEFRMDGSRFEELKDRFALESRERLARIRVALRDLSLAPDDSGSLKMVLGEFHRLAGSASIFKFHKTSKAAAEAEKKCRAYLENGAVPTTAEIDFLKEAVTQISREVWSRNVAGTLLGKLKDRIIILTRRNTQPVVHAGLGSQTAILEVVGSVEDLESRLAKGGYLGVLVDVFASGDVDDCARVVAKQKNLELPHLPLVALTENLNILDRMRLSQAGVTKTIPSDAAFESAEEALREMMHMHEPEWCIRIFVLAKNPELRESIKNDLAGGQRFFYLFDSPSDTINQWINDPPDVLIIDATETEYKALELCRRLRLYEQFGNVNILLLVSDGDRGARESVFDCGASDYCLLPYSGAEIKARLGPRLHLMKMSEETHRSVLGAKFKQIREASPEPQVTGNEPAIRAQHGRMQLFDGKVRVLVADDDKFVIEMLDFYLKKEGWEVLTAKDGAEAENMLKTGKYSILLLDVMMPFHTGFDVLKWLRTTDLMNSMRVVMLTAHDQDSTVRQAFDLGADDFIAKPFNPELVVTRLKRFLSK